jgi:hypothetical protein
MAMDIDKALGTYRTQFAKDIRTIDRPTAVLRALANTEFQRSFDGGGREVKIFTTPEMSLRNQKLDDRDNLAEIPRQDGQFTEEIIRVNETSDFNLTLATKLIGKLSEIPNWTEKLVRQIHKNFEQRVDIDIASNFVRTPNLNIVSGAENIVNGAVAAGATEIILTDATDFAPGDFIFFTDTAGKSGAALIKAKSTNTLTIETDAANFPTEKTGGKKEFFKKLETALPEIADGSVVKGDAPITISKTTFYDYLVDLGNKPLELDVDGGGFNVFSSLKPITLFKKDESVLLKNDFLGKDVILNGEVRKAAGMNVISSNNGISRIDGNGERRFYIWVVKRGQSFHFIDWLDSFDVNKLHERAGTVFSNTGLWVYQSEVLKQAANSMALLCCKI